MNKPNQTNKVHEYQNAGGFVLPLAVYKKIEAKFPRPAVGNNTTPTEAGYLLGIQAVLRVLRDDHTVGA